MSQTGVAAPAVQLPARLAIGRTLWDAFKGMWRNQKAAYLVGSPFLFAMLAVQVTVATLNPFDEDMFLIVSILEIGAYQLAMAGMAIAALRFCLVRLFPAPLAAKPDLPRFLIAYLLLVALPNYGFWQILAVSGEFPQHRNAIMLTTLLVIALLHVRFAIALPANADGQSMNGVQAFLHTRRNVTRISLIYVCVALWFVLGLILMTLIQIFGSRLFGGPPAYDLPPSEQIALEHWPSIIGIIVTFPVQVWLAFFPCAVLASIYRRL